MTDIGKTARDAVRVRRTRAHLAKLGAGMLLGAAVLALPGAGAQAAVIDPALSITGSAEFVFSDVDGGAIQSGTTDLTSGGVASQSTIAGTTVTGSDPLTGALTDTGDGVGASGSLSGTFDNTDNLNVDEESRLVVDLTINVSNTSATDTFKITFKVAFDNSVDADGPDAFAESEFTVDSPPGTEIFFTDLTSDTLVGDQVNGVNPGTFGDALSDSGATTFDLTFAPGATGTIAGELDMDVGAFDMGSSYTADLTAFLSIDSVMNLTAPPPPPPTAAPEPGTLSLFVAGLAVLGLIARRQRAVQARQRSH